MARLLTAGAETKAVTADGLAVNGATPTVETTIIHGGVASWKCVTPGSLGNASAVQKALSGLSTSTIYYARGFFYYSGFDNATRFALTDITHAGLHITSGGVVQLWNENTNAQIGSNGPTLLTGQWYRLEVAFQMNTSTTGYAEGMVDGTSFASATNLNLGAGTSSTWNWGWSNTNNAVTCYVDDLAINDSTGGNQNTWPGNGKVVLLVPTATSAAAAKWTDNDGTQTNMWQGAANTPPVGVAAATSPSHKYVKHAGGAAGTTDAFDATMTTYSVGGIASGDTINLIQYLVITGEESATGSKLLALAGVSNPTVAQGSSFDVFPSSGAQGTYPTNWQIKSDGLAIQYAPSVTVGTAPVMRVVRPETASRVASVAFMGMVVDYTPATATFMPAPPYIQPNQAVHRAATR